MKLLDEKTIRKSLKTASCKSILKQIIQPRRVTLRSQKINYLEESPYEQSDNVIDKNQETLAKSNEKAIKQSDQSPQKKKSKEFESSNKAEPIQIENQLDNPERSNFLSEFDGQQNNQVKYLTPIKRKKRQVKPYPLTKIMNCDQFKEVSQVDFLTYFGILTRKKMYSTLLIDEYGQVIFADRLGSQHFEGSLNNFVRNPIYSTVLEQDLDSFFEKVAWIEPDRRTVVKLIIYSKNSKRRYSKKPSDKQLTNTVIFNRYLRCISSEIKPIKITISSTDQIEGYWNKNLINQSKPLKCFLMTSRLSKKMPSLDMLDLKTDKKIQKFLKYTQKKQQALSFNKSYKYLSRKQDQQSEKGLQNYQDEKQQFSDPISQKEIQSVWNQYNENNKQSKSALTRGQVLNSGQGKCSSGKERI